jgi:hypothetical protein
MAKRHGRKKLVHRVLTWVGVAMTLSGIAFLVLTVMGVLRFLYLLFGLILVVVGPVVWLAAWMAGRDDHDDPQNPFAVSAMGARG